MRVTDDGFLIPELSFLTADFGSGKMMIKFLERELGLVYIEFALLFCELALASVSGLGSVHIRFALLFCECRRTLAAA